MTIRSVTTVALNLPFETGVETMIEYSYCDLGANPLGDAIRVADGEIAVPSAPGLGRDPDPDVLARYQVR